MILHDCQQGTDAWWQCRLGIPTASGFKRLLTSKGALSESLNGYAAELAAELFTGRPLESMDGNAWMQRGKEHEAEARASYAFIHDVEVKEIGFVSMDDACAGCSPDGLIGDDGGLEIKCLKPERHIAAVHYYKKHGKIPSDYLLQVQGSLMVTERKWWDLWFWSPELPPLAIRATPDKEIHAALSKAIAAVIAERDSQLASQRHQQTHIWEPK